MKRKAFILSMLLVPLFLYSQSVLGIKFGSNYNSVKQALEDRYGKYSVYEDNGNLRVYDLAVGDYKFDSGKFEFQRNGGNTYFYFAIFSEHYSLSNKKEAIRNRDFLFSLISDKYEYTESFVNDDGFKCYKFGKNPLDNSRVLGLITLAKGVGNDGISRYYLELSYGPIYYISKSSDF